MTPDDLSKALLNLPQELMYLPLIVAAPFAAFYILRFLTGIVRYMVADKDIRPMIRKAWVIKYRWKRDARRVGLMQIEKGRPKFWSSTPATTVIEREMIPPIKAKAERWGVSVDASTFGRLGLKQFQEAALYLADIWKVPQVRVEQVRPGMVRLRAIVRDPLTEPAQWTDQSRRVLSPAPVPVPQVGERSPSQPVLTRQKSMRGWVRKGCCRRGSSHPTRPSGMRA